MHSLDLDAYCDRIGWTGPRTPSFETVAGLLRAHMTAIPFENLDVLLGRGIQLDLESLWAKLVVARRGGYCFEHATLFEAALRALGVETVAHAARVLLVQPRAQAPRAHMLLTFADGGRTWVLDPGFGGHAPLIPVPLVEGEETRHGRDVHRMVRREEEWVLEGLVNGAMTALWTSSLEPQYPVDFEVANHWVSTSPGSPFTTRLMLRALTPAGRVSAMNRDVTLIRDGVMEQRRLADRRELRTLLAAEFGFDLPEVEALRLPSDPEWS